MLLLFSNDSTILEVSDMDFDIGKYFTDGGKTAAAVTDPINPSLQNETIHYIDSISHGFCHNYCPITQRQ